MDFGYIENSRSKILDIIKDKKEVSPRYIINNLLISERRVFVILKSLLEQGVLEKYGSPPFVYYKLKEKSEIFTRVEEYFEGIQHIEQEDTSDQPFLMGGHG